MKFGSIPVSEATGAILAHSLSTTAGVLKKGRVLSREDVAALEAAGLATVVAARLEAGDVAEDVAAARVATAVAGGCVAIAEPFTGRCNLYATAAGIAEIDATRIAQLNGIDEALTIATVAPFERVEAGQMLATVKVITFGIDERPVSMAETLARASPVADALVSVRAFTPHAAGLVLTRLASTKSSVLQKRRQVVADRLQRLGSDLAEVLTVSHNAADVAQAVSALARTGCDPILVFAASAIVDRGDVVPAGLTVAGGEVVHLGMPVDPGNLLMLGRLGPVDVIGVPSCAASPKLNGFDWVLERRLAGLPVGRQEIAAMGVGGLLKEIASRPQPREGGPEDGARREPRIAAVILAAGRSTRMGARNKLTETVAGKPMVRHAVEAALASRAKPVLVVTGHQADDVAGSLAGLVVEVVHNPAFAGGLSTSLKAGIAALPAGIDGAVVLLGDMPQIEARHIDRLIAAFAPKEGRSIVVPVHDGKRGNPVLWGSEHFPAMLAIEGDTGARHVIGAEAERVVEVDLGSAAIFLDVDTPAALAAVREVDG